EDVARLPEERLDGQRAFDPAGADRALDGRRDQIGAVKSDRRRDVPDAHPARTRFANFNDACEGSQRYRKSRGRRCGHLFGSLAALGRGPFLSDESVERDPERTRVERLAADQGAGYLHGRRANPGFERAYGRLGLAPLDVELEATHWVREALHGPFDSRAPDCPAHGGFRRRFELE